MKRGRAVLKILGPPNTLRKDQAIASVDLTVDVDPSENVARLESSPRSADRMKARRLRRALAQVRAKGTERKFDALLRHLRTRGAERDVDGGARVRAGGALLVHDAFSSVGVTLALLRGVVFAGEWRYRGRAGSLAEYVRAPVSGRARAGNAAAQLAQLPWFARNLVVKALIVARLRSGPWPY